MASMENSTNRTLKAFLKRVNGVKKKFEGVSVRILLFTWKT